MTVTTPTPHTEANIPVEHIVLQNEEHIEDETEGPEAELGEVPEERGPVVVVVRVEHHLQDGEETADEVQEDVSDRPAYGGFALVVHVRLE